jgi:O-antigen ligase
MNVHVPSWRPQQPNPTGADEILQPSKAGFIPESLAVAFLYAGQFKAHPFFAHLPVDLTLALCVGTLVAAAGRIARDLGRESLSRSRLRYLGIFALFVLYVICSWAVLSEYSIGLKFQKFIVFNTTAFVVPLLCFTSAVRIRRFLAATVIIALIMDIESLSYLARGADYRFATGFDGSIDYNSLGRASGLAFFAVALDDNIGRNLHRGVLRASIAAFLTLGVFASVGRGSVLSFLATALFVLTRALFGAAGNLNRKRTIAVATIIATGLFAAIALGLGSRILQRLEAGWMDARAGTSYRMEIYRAAPSLVVERPLLGHGWDSWNRTFAPTIFNRHPHNIFLEVGVELGFVGMVLFFAVVGFPLQYCQRRRLWASPLVNVLLASVVFIFLTAQTSGDLTDNRILFSYLAILLNAAIFAYRSQSIRTPQEAGTGSPTRP